MLEEYHSLGRQQVKIAFASKNEDNLEVPC